MYPKLFHVDYSGGLSYSSESACLYFSLVNLTSVVTETVIVFLHLFSLLYCGAVSYGSHLLTTSIIASEVPPKSEIGTIKYITMSALCPTNMMTLGGASGVFVLMYLLGRRYFASPAGLFIAGLPGLRSIPYLYRKYWLPSTAASFRPRPRFFYLKRLIVRQSNFFFVFVPSISISSIILHTGVMSLYLLCTILLLSIYSTIFPLAWFDILMTSLQEGPWYGLLIFLMISLFTVVPGILMAIAGVTYFGYMGFISCFFEA